MLWILASLYIVGVKGSNVQEERGKREHLKDLLKDAKGELLQLGREKWFKLRKHWKIILVRRRN